MAEHDGGWPKGFGQFARVPRPLVQQTVLIRSHCRNEARGFSCRQQPRYAEQTELAETYSIHVVCSWIGNSRAVAQEHYLTVTDAHFAKAIQPVEKSAAESAAVSGGIGENGEDAESANPSESLAIQGNSLACTSVHMERMPGTGFEPARAFAHQHLKLARLPISPPGPARIS